MAKPRVRVRAELVTLMNRWPKAVQQHDGGLTALTRSYESDLEDLASMDENSVVQAIIEVRKSSKFLPTVRDIREHAVELMDRDLWVMEAAAWGEIERAAKRYGPTRKTVVLREIDGKEYGVEEVFPGFSSPIIEAAVEAVGWENICNERGENGGVIRGQVRKAMEQIQNRVREDVVSGRFLTTPRNVLASGQQRGMRSVGDVVAGMIGPGKDGTHEAEANTDQHRDLRPVSSVGRLSRGGGQGQQGEW